jgi:hypothetical protein
LWVLPVAGALFVVRRPGQTENQFLTELLAQVHGTSVGCMEGIVKSADDLDLVELIQEMEEAINSPDAQHDVDSD